MRKLIKVVKTRFRGDTPFLVIINTEEFHVNQDGLNHFPKELKYGSDSCNFVSDNNDNIVSYTVSLNNGKLVPVDVNYVNRKIVFKDYDKEIIELHSIEEE